MTSSDNDFGDWQLKDGKWEKWDFRSRLPEGADIEKALEEQGWSEFFGLGEDDAELGILTWWGKDGYLLRVGDVTQFSPFVKVGSFPELMDLLAKWAPAVQSAALTGLIRSANEYGLSDNGAAEIFAAKAAYGVGVLREKMETEKRQREHAAWRKRQQRGQD